MTPPKRVLWGLILVLMSGGGLMAPSLAQSDDPLPILLLESIDPQTNGINLAWVDLNSGGQRPITTLNSASFCPPQRLPDGQTLLYEPFAYQDDGLIYRVNLQSGTIRPFDRPDMDLQCPTVSPTAIAWLKTTEDEMQVIITDPDGLNGVILAEHPRISDLQWSADGAMLAYRTGTGDLIVHEESAITVWNPDQGQLHDYHWVGAGLAILYQPAAGTDEAVWRASYLTPDCQGDPACPPRDLATLPADHQPRFTGAITPDHAAIVLIETWQSRRGEQQSDLYRLSLEDDGRQRLTNSPDIIKTDAIWIDETLYFLGSHLDAATLRLDRSVLYQLGADGVSRVAYHAEGYYPLHILGQRDTIE